MNTIALKTNLHCGSCVAKLQPILDGDTRIHHWNADMKSPDKIVEIQGNLSEAEARQLIEKAGFSTKTDTSEVACEMPINQSGTVAIAAPVNFWSDNKVWRRAGFNTLNCLIGCSIGDFGMIIFLQAYYPETPMLTQMMLAIIAGLFTSVLLETTILRLREKLTWKFALQMALSMSFLSMVAMEIAMNATDFMITGGKAALSSPTYWLAFIPAAIAGFLTPLPYNYFQLKKYNKACH